MESLPWGVLGPVAGAGLGWMAAFYFVRLVYVGKMVPRSIYEDQRQAAQDWRRAYEEEREARRRVLTPMAQLQREVLSSLPPATGEIPVVKDGER